MGYGAIMFAQDKACYQVSLKFPCNKAELKTLVNLDHYLKHKNKTIVSQVEFIDAMTGNVKVKRYLIGYISGLLKRDYIGSFEFIAQPGSVSLGISDLGIKVVREFDIQMDIVLARYPISPYRLDGGYSQSFTEDPKVPYKWVQRQTA